MPIYDFECEYCQITFEVDLPISNNAKIGCRICGRTSKKIFKPVAIHFKGKGWGKD